MKSKKDTIRIEAYIPIRKAWVPCNLEQLEEGDLVRMFNAEDKPIINTKASSEHWIISKVSIDFASTATQLALTVRDLALLDIQVGKAKTRNVIKDFIKAEDIISLDEFLSVIHKCAFDKNRSSDSYIFSLDIRVIVETLLASAPAANRLSCWNVLRQAVIERFKEVNYPDWPRVMKGLV